MEQLLIEINENEYFFGGATHHGRQLPIGRESRYKLNLRVTGVGNQSAPFFLSTQGRYVWSDAPFTVKVRKGRMIFRGEKPIMLFEGGETLKDAFISACQAHFKPIGKVPVKEFFAMPQYNTWVELLYNHSQKGVLEYADNMLSAGLSSGVIMIDDSWQADYGTWRFNLQGFENPKQMVDKLHNMGFKVMLWIVPYVSKTSEIFKAVCGDKDGLFRTKSNKPKIVKWWNGYSFVLDFRKPTARKALDESLDYLTKEYGIDGFKFDGGGIDDFIRSGIKSCDAVALNGAYFTYASKYEMCEAKDTYGLAELPIAQRLRDKRHRWDKNGLSDLIPDAINASLLGYRFLCPDMVGGGEWRDFKSGKAIDEELVVRYAECAALFPMMQFSINPCRVLSAENLKIVVDAAKLHEEFGDYIVKLAEKSAYSGEPILRPLCYNFPNSRLESVNDEFMLGEEILSAPVLRKGQRSRTVVLPEGRWQYVDKTVFEGGQTVTVKAELDTLPYFVKIC